MSFLVDPLKPAGNLVPEVLRGIAAVDDLPVQAALPTVNPGDDDDEDDDERGNIDPDEDEGTDDDEEDDEDDPLWAKPTLEREYGNSRRLLQRNISLMRRPSHRRHTAQPACRVAI